MEKLISTPMLAEQLYQIMGSEGTQQFLQLVLLPYQHVVTCEQAIQYTSENVKVTDRFNFRERIKHYLLG